MTRELKKLTIISYFHEQSMTFGGLRYRYIIDDKFQTSGSFAESLLPTYEKIYDINWKESYMRIR